MYIHTQIHIHIYIYMTGGDEDEDIDAWGNTLRSEFAKELGIV